MIPCGAALAGWITRIRRSAQPQHGGGDGRPMPSDPGETDTHEQGNEYGGAGQVDRDS